MKLSNLLCEFFPNYEYQIVEEHEFDTFGLVGSETGGLSVCTFIDNEEFISDISDHITMILTNESIAKKIKNRSFGLCIIDKPRIVFFKLHNYLSDIKPYAREKKNTFIGKNCKIHPTAVIAPDNVIIGDNTIIEEYVSIRENTVIGDNCIIRTGVKIGCPDFEFKRDGDELFGVKHCGGVIIGNNVEILSNTGVNAALYPWDNTVIGDYCKIDMLCNISHGAKIGKGTMIVALSGIGGRTVVGNYCWIGYGAILRNGITVGNNSRVNMGAVVSKDVADNESVTGNFAIKHELFMSDLKQRARKDNCDE
ncbi:MAG: UDP-3-O-(3-hydroxymyristoyl)glucosamine N-acyltransferase [Candidatus Fimisoma sp.]|nr:UDP-3-O-(3-hydroxymyristoyl)glucosamine N-acyltransferase [Candidatus Fimisoma sp.]